MRHVAAYLLAVLGGNKNPSADDLKNIMASVGIEAKETELKKVLSELEGKNIDDIIAAGSKKLASFGCAAAGGAAAPAAAAAGGDAATDAKAKKEESEEEADLGGGMDMFGGGADY